MAHFGMNKQRAAHMDGKRFGEDSHKEASSHDGGHAPSIHIHSHAKGHTVHIMHPSGEHEKHEHEHGDSDGIAAHIHEHIGGESGQDHGEDSGMDEADNFSLEA